MHSLEPYYGWIQLYESSKDDRSPFYGLEHSEFEFQHKVYNYYLHPQWDSIGSETLYAKLLFADYQSSFAVLELIGEWNDCLHNDIMYLKRNIADKLIDQGITKFILCMDKVLNFHVSDGAYYEEWVEEISDEDGWVVAIEIQEHVLSEIKKHRLQQYLQCGDAFNALNWRKLKPQHLFKSIEQLIQNQPLSLS